MISHLLLVLLLPVYVNLVKELFLLRFFQAVFATVFPKASAKVLLFPELAKFFSKYFPKKMHFSGLDDGNQGKSEMFGEYEQTFEKMREGEGRRAEHGSIEQRKKKKARQRRLEKGFNPLVSLREGCVSNNQQQQDDG